MRIFMVTYDLRGEKHTQIVNELDASKAYLKVYLEMPNEAIITELFEII